MKPLANLILFACLAARARLRRGRPESRFRTSSSTTTRCISVPVSGTRVTTISFPSAISAIDAALVTTDAKDGGTVPDRAHQRHVLLFGAGAGEGGRDESEHSLGRPHLRLGIEGKRRALAFGDLSTARREKATKQRPLTPARLLGLLDKAKAFPLLSEYHPEALAGVEFRDGTKQPSVTDCGDYEVRVNEAFRFDLEDTLVFRLTLQNKTLKAIQFAPERVRLKVGTRTLFPSVTQLGGFDSGEWHQRRLRRIHRYGGWGPQ